MSHKKVHYTDRHARGARRNERAITANIEWERKHQRDDECLVLHKEDRRELIHTCGNPRCVNPKHMKVVMRRD